MALTKTPICDFGKKAEGFKLKSINNKSVSLEDIRGKNGTLIMFICNHCPYVKAIIKDLVEDCKNLKAEGINSVAIMSNDTKNYPEDSYTKMIEFAKDNRFGDLDYLIDETQEVAKKYGYFVTFMPKTNISDWRSGAHINHSVASIKTKNQNIYKDGESFSDKAYNGVAGILKHGAAITALACPTVNSYNGFVSSVEGLDGGLHTWAPTHMTYGTNNRSAMIRLPQNRFCIENRASDLTQNPYLTFALLAAAVTEGIEKDLKPPKITNKSLYDLTEKEKKEIATLPRNLLEAVDSFSKDKLIHEVFSKPLINNFVSYKYDEWRRYHTTTTDWEIKEYLKLF